MFSSRCAALLLALTACVTASFPNPLPCSGICTDTHDPTLIRRQSDGTYYRFATGGGMDIHTAPTLTGPWSSAGVVLPNGSKIDNSGAKDAWAPDVHHIEGEYVLYYAVSTFGTQESVIGVATSSTMATGTWTDHGSTGLQSVNGSAYNCIDPNLIVVNGTDYMSFGSFWSDIFQTTFRAPQALEWTSETPYQLEFNATSPQPSEGSYVFEADGWFYLFFSSGLCCGLDVNTPPAGDEYKVMVCRSRDVAGGYVDKKGTACTKSGGTLVLGSHGEIYAPGGEGLYNDPHYGPVMYYHYFNTSIGIADADALLGINRVDFSSGWPVLC